MNNTLKIRRLVGIAVLLALVVVLQLISNYITFGPISITLALIPLTMGAILYGPLVGLFLGLVMGALIIVAPSTQVFLSFNIWYTILLCLVKTGLAGLVSGLVFNLFLSFSKVRRFVVNENGERKKSLTITEYRKKVFFPIAIIVSALLVPIINTGIFLLFTPILFTGLYGDLKAAYETVIGLVLTTNFLVEFLVSAILSPALVYLVKVLGKQKNMGFQKDFTLYAYDKVEEKQELSNVNSDELFK